MSQVASNTLDTLFFAGDVTVNEVTIVTSRGLSITVTPQVAGVEIYEDIFSPFMSGKVYVRDGHSLSTLMPLIGEEYIKIDITTPSIDKKYGYRNEFFIYKVDDRQITKEREEIYVLHFISKEAIIDLNRKISRTYKGNIGDIVKEVVTGDGGLESKKELNIDTPSGTTKYTSNFWSPVRNLMFLCDAAVTTSTTSPTYTFFENKFGLHFVALDTLYDAPVHQKFFYDNSGMVINAGGGSSRNIQRDFNRIIKMEIPTPFDFIDRIQSGMFGSQMTHYDLVTKKYTRVGYTPDFSSTSHLNDHPMWTDKVTAKNSSVMIHEFKHFGNFNDYKDVSNSKHAQKRLALMAQAEAFKLKITVPGRVDYSAGQVVDLIIPKRTQITENQDPEEFLDKVLSGKYLIAAICHIVTKEGHECVMELVKDSFMVNIGNV